MMTAIWSATRAFGPPAGGNGGGNSGNGGGGKGKKNKAPDVPDVLLNFDNSINDAPEGQSQDLAFDVATG